MLPESITEDLKRSGLVADDVFARQLEAAERASTVTPHSVGGYVLPYFDISGKLLPFYRVRLFDDSVKYRQPKDLPNHVYFPRKFWETLGGKQYVILTVGEKRAACACRRGYPAVGFGSVDSWKNRIITVGGDAKLSEANKKLAIKINSTDEIQEEFDSPVAAGFTELIDLIKSRGLFVVIVYDTNNVTDKVDSEAQRICATLGYELRFRGIDFGKIRQLVLPRINLDIPRVGLDDFLVHRGEEAFNLALRETIAARSAFPLHPNVRDYVNKRLQSPKMTRKERQNISLAILSDLDSHGMRLRNPAGETYYFDFVTRKLIKAVFANTRDQAFDAPFTQFLYKEYGLSAADAAMTVWLGTQFSAEQPIEDVEAYKVFARPDLEADEVLYQVSDSEFLKLTAEGLEVHNNGDFNVLFESDQVEPIDPKAVEQAFIGMQASSTVPQLCWWAKTLSEVRLRDKDKQRIIASLLYYMSPWLFRWRGMQLPVELIIGESGSGKSTLCELRLDIITGRPLLRNVAGDIKDWHASVTGCGGLHVTDNVQLVDRTMRQKLSDEMCRIVTEPEPFIEQRKYFTNADVLRMPVRAVFALTAIQQPFQNSDLLQRAIILELDKSIAQNKEGLIRYDSAWKANQIARFGGREKWMAHHLFVLNKFFRLVKERWNANYQAKHRLINFEQSIMLMAEVFGIPSEWIPDYLVNATDNAVSEADWILEGLHAFAEEHNIPTIRGKRFRASVIAEWAADQEEYKRCEVLINTRKLGKYLRAHKSAIFHLTGIAEAGQEGNRMCYKFDARTPPRQQPLA